MFPAIGGVKTYLFFYGASMVAHFVCAIIFCRRLGLSRKVGVALGIAYFWGMCIGARVLYDLIHNQFQWWNYLEIGYYFTDGLWGGPLAYLAVAGAGVMILGRNRRLLRDLVVLPLPYSMIVAKVACFFNGCCYGAESEWPWALTFPEGAEAPHGVARHATQLYEILALLVILLVFHLLDHKRWRGRLILWFVFLYGIGRPLTEVFRAGEKRVARVGPFSDSQAVCLAAAAVCAVWLFVIWRTRETVRRSKDISATPTA